jgi:hypothetical protein
MGWYLDKLNWPPTILVLFFLFHFFNQMDTGRGVHWGIGFLEGEECCDHAHPWRGVSMWVSQRTCGACPR